MVDGILVSIEEALKTVSSHLNNSADWEAVGQVGWIVLTALKANMDQALWCTIQLWALQEKQEALEQCICTVGTKVSEASWSTTSKG